MNRDYDATPAHLLGRAKSWYELSTKCVENLPKDFTVERYIAFCFSVEFLLKAFLCIDKSNANTSELKKYSHKLGITKEAALEVVKDDETIKLVVSLFTKYPELEDRDVIETRYGKLGSSTSYDANMLSDPLYLKLISAADSAIRKEWLWRNTHV